MFIGHKKKFNQLKVMYLYKGKKTLEHILFNTVLLRRSQDGGGIGRGDHFLSYKFIKRTIEG